MKLIDFAGLFRGRCSRCYGAALLMAIMADLLMAIIDAGARCHSGGGHGSTCSTPPRTLAKTRARSAEGYLPSSTEHLAARRAE